MIRGGGKSSTGGGPEPPQADGEVVALPGWIVQLRRTEIVDRVRKDPRSDDGSLLGVDANTVFHEVIAGGQADFDKPWGDLTPDDRALLYAHFNMVRHLEELTDAFFQLFGTARPENPIVVDLGCGPFTGGLALAGVLGPRNGFAYLGIDRSEAMRRLGERLASVAERTGCAPRMERRWESSMDDVVLPEPPGWRPVIVILSFLLASPSLLVANLVQSLDCILMRLGCGSVTVLYTNSERQDPNRNYPILRDALLDRGFEVKAENLGQVVASRHGEEITHRLRYALFQRPAQSVLKLR